MFRIIFGTKFIYLTNLFFFSIFFFLGMLCYFKRISWSNSWSILTTIFHRWELIIWSRNSLASNSQTRMSNYFIRKKKKGINHHIHNLRKQHAECLNGQDVSICFFRNVSATWHFHFKRFCFSAVLMWRGGYVRIALFRNSFRCPDLKDKF